jgi:hypothetical protein
MDIHCEFSNPVKADGVPPNLNSQTWNFKNFDCVATSTPTDPPELPLYMSEIVSTSTPEKNFYLSKTIDLGQVLILGFFLLAFLFAVVLSIQKLVFKK